MITVTAREGELVDELCWRALGRTEKVTEQTLQINPGLAALGPRLPAGKQVLLPDLPETALPEREVVKLWD